MAAIDLNTVRSTIEGRLKTELDTNPAIPVVFNNMPYTPTPGSDWVQCLVNFGANTYITHGGSSGSDNNLVGVAVFNIFTAPGVGPGGNLTIGKRIRDLFNRQKVSGVYFDPPEGPEVITASAPEGYFQTQITMTFDTYEEL